MDKVIDWLNAKPVSGRRASLIGLGIVAVVLVVATAVATHLVPVIGPVAPMVGAVAGGLLFVSCYGYWRTVLPPDKQADTDLKAKYPLRQRRGLVGVMLAVWIILLLLTGDPLPDLVLGTLNVWVAISLYWLWRATPDEAAEALAAYEAAQTEREAAVEAELDADEADDDFYR